jgi:hypothetical protein
VVPAEVVVVDEVSESPLQLAGLFIGDLIYLLLDGPVLGSSFYSQFAGLLLKLLPQGLFLSSLTSGVCGMDIKNGIPQSLATFFIASLGECVTRP